MNRNHVEEIIRRLAVVISIAIFAMSLSHYAYCTLADKNGECTRAMSLLLVGGLGIFMGELASILWVANLTLLATWVLVFISPRFTPISSMATLLLMLLFLVFDKVLVNEAGGKSTIVSHGTGYWLWVLSAAVMVAGIFFARLFSRPKPVAQTPFDDSLFQQ
ncbi:hypothetical protein [Hymenobacter negativus]|uniref:Uncharacterized protein n=1 Tax=Hymenobacter negativus TaxID=2795026 RepID=A0ABS0Q8S3_9BACT|nr:hypothetical protein [Hymenobacter negativus]MBH8559087.1 hypothetical protein [Hymenobacter negativus]